MKKKHYHGCCVELPGSHITDMVDKAKEITFQTFCRHTDKQEVESVFPMYAGCKGLTLGNDYAVRFFRSAYRGNPCVFVDHSAIEYIFK